MWKPGQLVTVCGKVFRVAKAKNVFQACEKCVFACNKASIHPCANCRTIWKTPKQPNRAVKLWRGCYLKSLT